jgi:hypothetical protein
MIQMTGNASASLSYRNAVMSVIPQALWMPILEKSKKVAVGGTASVNERRMAAIEYGKKVGVSPDQVFSTLGVQGVNDIGIDELVTLKGLFNALKDGEMTIEEAFGDPYEKELDELFEKLQYNKGRRAALMENYKGRSTDLLTYLREQAKPLAEAPKVDAKPAANEIVPEQKTEEAPAAEPAKKRGRPAKTETAAEPVVEEKKPEPVAEEKPVEKSVEKKAEPEAGAFDF